MPFIAVLYLDGYHTADDLMSAPLPPGVRLVAVHEFPDRAELRNHGCKGCTPPGRKVVGWGRSKKGHIICGGCGGRNPKVRQWFAGSLFDWFGANIYPGAPALFRTPEGYSNSPR